MCRALAWNSIAKRCQNTLTGSDCSTGGDSRNARKERGQPCPRVPTGWPAASDLKKAVGTAKYANHAKSEPFGEQPRSTHWVNAPIFSTRFLFAYLAFF